MPISPDNIVTNDPELASVLFSAKKVLFTGAHPDDIEFYCAGTVYQLRQCGVEIIYTIATRGGRGYKGIIGSLLKKIRMRNQETAANVLGGAKVIFYDYPDGGLSEHIEQLSDDLKALIEQEKPDVILGWDPDFIYNPHPDHQTAADAVKIAAYGCKSIYYGTREPNLLIGYDDEILRIKLKSLLAHRTETPFPYNLLLKKQIIKRTVAYGVKIDAKYAESFRLVR